MRKTIWIAALALLFAGACASAGSVDTAVLGSNTGQTCDALDTGHQFDATGATHTATAPAGFLISRFCVKAGSAHQGNGPETFPVEPPQATLTFSHSSGKDISHYSLEFVPITDPTPTPDPCADGRCDPTPTPDPCENGRECDPNPTPDPCENGRDCDPTPTPDPCENGRDCDPTPTPDPCADGRCDPPVTDTPPPPPVTPTPDIGTPLSVTPTPVVEPFVPPAIPDPSFTG